jgi:hypothetical protein
MTSSPRAMTDARNEQKEGNVSKTRNLEAELARAISEWEKKNTEGVIRARVADTLKRGEDQIIRKLLGFDKDSWGRDDWKLDHCNGRSGNSPVGTYLASAVKAQFTAWLDGVIATFKPPKDMEKSILAAYKEAFGSAVKSHARKLAEQHAEEKIKALVEKLTKATGEAK